MYKNADGVLSTALPRTYTYNYASGNLVTWVDAIYPYVKGDQIFTCANDVRPNRYATGTGVGTVGYLGCISYAMNGQLTGYNVNNNGDMMWDQTYIGYWSYYGNPWGSSDYTIHGQKLSAISSAALKALVTEGSKQYVGSEEIIPLESTFGGSWAYYRWPVDTSDWKDPNTASTQWSVPALAAYEDGSNGRHFGGVNMAYIDGHVKWLAGRTPGLFYTDIGTNVTTYGGGSYSREAINLWCPYMDGK